eukprot:gene15213-18002_t
MFFLREANSGIHLVLLNERLASVTWFLVENTDLKGADRVPYKIHCFSCKKSVGSQLVRHGLPLRKHLMCMTAADVLLELSDDYLPHKTWKAGLNRLVKYEIKQMDLSNIDGRTTQEKVDQTYQPTKIVESPDLNMPLPVTPYEYQIEEDKVAKRMALFLVTKVPLALQQGRALRQFAGDLDIGIVCGGNADSIDLDKKRPDVIVCTVDCSLNWLSSGILRIEDFYLIILDEAHNATGSHSFVRILEMLPKMERALQPRVLGLTASPCTLANSHESMVKTIKTLEITMNARVYRPPSLEIHIKRVSELESIKFQYTPLEKMCRNTIIKMLNDLVERAHTELEYSSDKLVLVGEENLNTFTHAVKEMERYVYDSKRHTDVPLGSVLGIIHLYGCMNISGTSAVIGYLKNQLEEKNLPEFYRSKLTNILEGISDGSTRAEQERHSSKMVKLIEVIQDHLENGTSADKFRAIVFVQTRSTARLLLKTIKREAFNDKLHAKLFVGHGNTDGMDTEKQEVVMKQFRSGYSKLLVATSVLEEGIDVQSCNLVVCFENDLNLRAMIQRRGRARADNSRCLYFQAPETETNASASLLSAERMLKAAISELMERNTFNTTESERNKRKQLLITWSQTKEKEANLHSSKTASIFMSFYHTTESFNDVVNKKVPNLLNFENIDHRHETRKYLAKSKLVSMEYSESKLNEVFTTLKHLASDHFWWAMVNIPQSLVAKPDDTASLPGAVKNATDQATEYVWPVVIGCGNMRTPTTYHERSYFPATFIYQILERRIIIRQTSMTDNGTIFHQDHVIFNEDMENFVLNDITTKSFYLVLKRPPRILKKTVNPDTNEATVVERIDRFKIPPFCDNYVYRCVFQVDESRPTIDSSIVQQWLKMPLYHCSINTLEDQDLMNMDVQFDYTINRRVSYLLEVLTSNKTYGKTHVPQELYNYITDLLKEEKKVEAEELVLKAIDAPTFGLMATVTEPLVNIVSTKEPPPNYVHIKKVMVTPTRVIFKKPMIMQMNRAIRLFGADRFLQVQFTDEDNSDLIEYQPLLMEYHERILSKGIYIHGFGTYHYLGNSSSQARHNTCWFYCDGDIDGPGPSLDEVRRDLVGKKSLHTNPRKYLRSLNIVFASTRPTLVIPPEEYHENVDDYIVDKHIFTEGIGYIGRELAVEIADKCDVPRDTAAFQIRIGGNKGVVAVHPHLKRGLYLRGSMRKFATEPTTYNRTLEIISVSGRKLCFLNRQVINLLSGLGVPDSYFLELLSNALGDLARMLHDTDEAMRTLTEIEIFKNVTEPEILLDPFVRSTLHLVYKKKLSNYRDKCFIPIETARTLMGVTDETATMVTGQVFLRITEPNGALRTIVGRVAVAKNPCLHPGDVRILNAVDVPALHHLIDVIVFAQRGHIPNFKECSGSDLDGDRYFVCYGTEMLKSIKMFSAYVGDEANAPLEPEPIEPETIIRQFVDNIQKGSLGTIALTHLAVCDRLSPTDPLAIELAIQHYIEVDSAKTGKHGKIPDGTDNIVGNMQFFPRFMQRSMPRKQYWESIKVLGKLYEQCSSLNGVAQYLPDQDLDQELLVKGYETYIDEAKLVYLRYCSAVSSLLSRYDLEHEEEVLAQFADETISGAFNSKEVMLELYNNYAALQAQFRDEFLMEFISQSIDQEHIELDTDSLIAHNQDEIDKKASAWYATAYSDIKPIKFLSFYWLVKDMRRPPTAMDAFRAKAFLSRDVSAHLFNNQNIMLSSYASRLQIAATICKTLKRSPHLVDSQVLIYGSSSLFVFHTATSDLDLHLCPNLSMPMTNEEVYLAVVKALKFSDLAIENIEYVENAKFPIVRFRYNGIDCDMSLDSNGFEKTLLVTQYFNNHPFLLPLTYAIVSWGRESGLLIHSENDIKSRSLKTWSLIWMFIEYCLKKSIIIEVPVSSCSSIRENKSSDWWIDVLTSCHSAESINILGKHLLGFFKYYTAELGTGIWCDREYLIMCPLDSEIMPSLHLSPKNHNYSYLHESFQLAYHSLSSTGNIQSFLKRSLNENSKIFHLDKIVSKQLMDSEEYFENRISMKTGATIQIQKTNRSRYQVKISGDLFSIQQAIAEITMISKRISNCPFLFSKNMVTGGGTTLLFEASKDSADSLKCIDYTGTRINLQHMLKRPFTPVLKSPPTLEDLPLFDPYKDSFFEYNRVIFQQMTRWYRYGTFNQYGPTKAYLRFGSIYLINVPNSGYEQMISEMRKSISSNSKVTIPLNEQQHSKQIALYTKKETKSTGPYDAKYEEMNATYGIDPLGKEQRYKTKMPEKKRSNDTPAAERSERDESKPQDRKKVPKSSFYTHMIEDTLLVELLVSIGWKLHSIQEDYYAVSLNSRERHGMRSEYKIEVDKNFTTTTLKEANLSWFTADLKSITDNDIDVRFSIQSKKTHTAATSPEFTYYTREPMLTAKKPDGENAPFTVSPLIKDMAYLVRLHSNIRIFEPPPDHPLASLLPQAYITNVI